MPPQFLPKRQRLPLRRRLGLTVLLLLACATPRLSLDTTRQLPVARRPSSIVAGTSPQPILHPSLADALSAGFNLLVGPAPFAVQLWVKNDAGYQQHWELGGAAASEAPAGEGILARFERPGVYYPSVRLSARGRPTLTLSQRIVVLASAPAANPPGKYGVNQDLAWDVPEQTGPEVRLMRAAGVEWLRLPIRWSWVEPQPGVYDWHLDDPVVDQASSAGLRVLAVLGSTPSWSSGVSRNQVPAGVHADAYAPARSADFARDVYQVVQHYQGRVAAYELLNEPNSINHWRPRPDAARFIELLCAGYYAAKYSDPYSLIVAGGLSGNGLFLGWEPPESRDFLKAIYDGPGAHCFDVMAIHPYAHPAENGLASLQQWVDETRAYTRARGDGRELWLTEVGWSSGPHLWGKATISQQQQADWVTAVYRDLAGPQKVFWYNFKDGTDPAMTDPEYHWGWLQDDLTPKPAYGAFKALQK
jgi:hypothetical protein